MLDEMYFVKARMFWHGTGGAGNDWLPSLGCRGFEFAERTTVTEREQICGQSRALRSCCQYRIERRSGSFADCRSMVKIITDAARSDGIQRVTFQQGGTTGQETTEEMGGVGYFRGDAFTLQNFNGFSAAAAAKYASVWLRVTKSDSAFAKVTAGLTMSTMPAQLMLPNPRLVGTTTLGGSRVRELRAVFTETSGTVTGLLYVRSRGVPLPVEQKFTQSSGAGSDVFSNWNEPVTVTAPTSSVPFAATGQ